MQLFRVSPAALALASVVLLTACGDSPTAAPASSAASASSASTVSSDRKLCASVQTIGDDLKDELVKVSQSGEDPTRALFTGVLNRLASRVTAEAFDAGDSAVAVAARQLGAKAAQAAKDPDPVAAAGAPAFDKAGADLTTACKTVGVTVTF